MELVALVERARNGDVDAFSELVARHQRLALGSAVALLHDPELARVVAPESFVAAWRGLASLADPATFPAWLHGIVRRQAFRALRARHLEPLTAAEHLAGDAPPADQQLDAERRRAFALAALAALPEGLREPAMLRYVHDCSQAQIAAFLGLPVTTVNNRLHEARGRLKRRMLAMMKDAFTDRALPEDFPARIGRVLRAEGPVVEARFEPAGPPELFSTLIAADEAGRAVTIEVVQHLPDGRVRAIARDPETTLMPGMQIVERGTVADRLLDETSLRSALDRLVRPAPVGPSRVLETGIKVIDVMMPVVRGGRVAILGGERVGTTVVMEELVRRLATAQLSVFIFCPVAGAENVREVREKEGCTFGMGGVETVFFMADGHASRDAFDTVIVLSPEIAAMKIYPAIDLSLARSGGRRRGARARGTRALARERGGRAGPEAAAGLARVALELHEQRLVADVRRDRHDLRVAAAHELRVHHGLAGPHVGEEPAVTVARLHVGLEPDGAAVDELAIHRERRAASRLLALSRVVDLGCIDADVAHLLDALADAYADGVAVDHADDGACEGLRGCGRRRKHGRADGEDRGEQDRGDRREERRTARTRHAATIACVRRWCPSMDTASLNGYRVQDWIRRALSGRHGFLKGGNAIQAGVGSRRATSRPAGRARGEAPGTRVATLESRRGASPRWRSKSYASTPRPMPSASARARTPTPSVSRKRTRSRRRSGAAAPTA